MVQARRYENPRARQRLFGNRSQEILALGMFDGAGDLAVFAANTVFWIDKHGFHMRLPFLWI
ncbi:MAG: hypothetical protein PVF70_03400 [Anaerolineales bacterium]|jgi:hypothetical protein